MNKNYRLLSFRSFFIFSFLSFFEGSPSSGCFFGWGREAKNTVLPESFFYIQIFSLSFIFTLFHFFYIFYIFRFFHFFTFLHFYNFQIFSLFYIFTFLQFFRGHSGRCFFFYVGRC